MRPDADAPTPTDGAAVDDAAFVLLLREKGLRDIAVLRAMERVPRESFVPDAHREQARRDIALPLPCGATMTAPSVVGRMLSRLKLETGQRVMEIGTGTGYVTALLDRLGAEAVLSLERYRTLTEDAATRLAHLPEAHVVHADALASALPDGGFDRILVNGCVETVPEHWLAALEPGGRIVTGLTVEGRCRLVSVAADGTREIGPAIPLAGLVPGLAQVL